MLDGVYAVKISPKKEDFDAVVVDEPDRQEPVSGGEEDEDDLCNGEAPPAPEGDCAIVYSECGYKGCFEEICEDSPELTKKIVPK